MPYDPNKPANGSPLSSPEMRAQLNALKALIDSIPAGPPGPPGPIGPQGQPFADAVIDGVTTLNAGEAALVSVTFDGTLVHFTFSIPRGDTGQQGEPGEVTNQQLTDAIGGTARNPSGQMGNLDPNWSPSGDTNADLLWLRDRLVELNNATAR